MDENEAPFNLEELEAKAETGDVEAQYEMGWPVFFSSPAMWL